jgi:GNAT superfamily N-acetyltransferase
MWDAELEGRGWPALAERFVAASLEAGHCVVAGWPGSDVVGGYCLGQRDADRAVCHWVYVKGLYRRRGIATMLVGALRAGLDEVIVTHTASRWQRARVRREGWRAADRLPWLWLLEYEGAHG